MNKLIIENRADMTDAEALQYAIKAERHDMGRTGSMAVQFGDITVHRQKNMISQTFIVMATERVLA